MFIIALSYSAHNSFLEECIQLSYVVYTTKLTGFILYLYARNGGKFRLFSKKKNPSGSLNKILLSYGLASGTGEGVIGTVSVPDVSTTSSPCSFFISTIRVGGSPTRVMPSGNLKYTGTSS